MSITAHPDWLALRPWIHIESYGRDTGRNGARSRIEVTRPTNPLVLRLLLAMTMPCVACGRTIHPIRERQGHGRLYYAATCSLDMTFSCARGSRARDEYIRVKQAINDYKKEQAAAQPAFSW